MRNPGLGQVSIDHGAALGVAGQLLLGERIAGDVLHDSFKPVGVLAPQRLAVVQGEIAVVPAQELAARLSGEHLTPPGIDPDRQNRTACELFASGQGLASKYTKRKRREAYDRIREMTAKVIEESD